MDEINYLAGGAAPTPMGTPPSPSYASGSQFSTNGPTLQAPELGTPGTQMYQRLQNFLTNPGQISHDPGFEFLFNHGMQAFNRTQAAKKMTMSGQAGLGAINFGQGLAANYFNQMVPQLQKGAEQELERYKVPAQLQVQRYGASHGGMSSGSQGSTGPNPGTQGDFAARDLMQRMQQRGAGPSPSAIGAGGRAAPRAGSGEVYGNGGGGGYTGGINAGGQSSIANQLGLNPQEQYQAQQLGLSDDELMMAVQMGMSPQEFYDSMYGGVGGEQGDAYDYADQSDNLYDPTALYGSGGQGGGFVPAVAYADEGGGGIYDDWGAY